MDKKDIVLKFVEFIKKNECRFYDGGVWEVHSEDLLDFVCEILGDETKNG